MKILPIYLKIGPNWQNRQCCLAGSSKTAHRILIFSIPMAADYSFYVKPIAPYAPTFLGYNNSVHSDPKVMTGNGQLTKVHS